MITYANVNGIIQRGGREREMGKDYCYSRGKKRTHGKFFWKRVSIGEIRESCLPTYKYSHTRASFIFNHFRSIKTERTNKKTMHACPTQLVKKQMFVRSKSGKFFRQKTFVYSSSRTKPFGTQCTANCLIESWQKVFFALQLLPYEKRGGSKARDTSASNEDLSLSATSFFAARRVSPFAFTSESYFEHNSWLVFGLFSPGLWIFFGWRIEIAVGFCGCGEENREIGETVSSYRNTRSNLIHHIKFLSWY